ncbi:MAG: 16S rRNA (guanine(966)-N(2))-methyltransferase RsmD [Neisseriaceae bacterium]|nr:16S rRNA (guanine(966)-N(2))-methyltransferase RsmD [Neisseriaceae bacterium]
MMKNPNHKNQVRIIGGTHRSRIITFNDANGLRPTADFVREKLFNWLGQDLYGKNVLDLFSGSGIMAFESASRNAKYIIAVENNKQTAEKIKQNKKLLKIDNIEIKNTNAFDFLRTSPDQFDIVFIDPPYQWQEWQTLWQFLPNILKTNAEIYIEYAQKIELPPFLSERKKGKCGISHFILAEYIVD